MTERATNNKPIRPFQLSRSRIYRYRWPGKIRYGWCTWGLKVREEGETYSAPALSIPDRDEK